MGRPMRSFTITESGSKTIDERAIPDARRGGGKPNFSRVLATIIDRYAEIVRQHRPSLTDAEWKFFAEVIGERHLDEPFQIRALGELVADALRLERMGKKYKVPEGFAAKIDALDYATKVAIVDAIELRRARGG